MAAVTMTILPPTTFNLANLANGGTPGIVIPLARRIDTSGFATVSPLIRWHFTIIPVTSSATVSFDVDGFTLDDTAADFGPILTTPTPPNPSYFSSTALPVFATPLTQGNTSNTISGLAQFYLFATRGAAGGFSFKISIDLTMRTADDVLPEPQTPSYLGYGRRRL